MSHHKVLAVPLPARDLHVTPRTSNGLGTKQCVLISTACCGTVSVHLNWAPGSKFEALRREDVVVRRIILLNFVLRLNYKTIKLLQSFENWILFCLKVERSRSQTSSTREPNRSLFCPLVPFFSEDESRIQVTKRNFIT